MKLYTMRGTELLYSLVLYASEDVFIPCSWMQFFWIEISMLTVLSRAYKRYYSFIYWVLFFLLRVTECFQRNSSHIIFFFFFSSYWFLFTVYCFPTGFLGFNVSYSFSLELQLWESFKVWMNLNFLTENVHLFLPIF